jgi:hypothetical protein
MSRKAGAKSLGPGGEDVDGGAKCFAGMAMWGGIQWAVLAAAGRGKTAEKERWLLSTAIEEEGCAEVEGGGWDWPIFSSSRSCAASIAARADTCAHDSLVMLIAPAPVRPSKSAEGRSDPVAEDRFSIACPRESLGLGMLIRGLHVDLIHESAADSIGMLV